jgi:UDP-N-acetylmuramate dehydrogenase
MTDGTYRTLRRASLASFTTLHAGGPASRLIEAEDLPGLRSALAVIRDQAMPLFVLGGGSNVVVCDEGWHGAVLRCLDRTTTWEPDGDHVRVRAGAGLGWDALVERAVERDLAGLECLSGIPGLVGAAPIQNIGAYGQEVAERLVAVEVMDRATGQGTRLDAAECGFGYRWSRFKGAWRDRYVVTAVELLLQRGGPPTLRYAELARRAEEAGVAATLGSVRELVLAIRRGKSMVLDPTDPDSRSAGSFFTNPQVDGETLATVRDAVDRLGLDPAGLPAWPTNDGRTKLAAAWLIERAGFHRGQEAGGAALSRSHVLALVNRGGGASAIVALAGAIRRRVRDVFGIALQPEPVFVGFDQSVDELLG